ncbi:hypothetical protein ACLF6K_01525 [Streptomyces xanthophaeus]|uniref:hypothetical protein n=1 Tax=Streptomyces xanthophaeus TaxID=67385 RepID=UPI00398FB85F
MGTSGEERRTYAPSKEEVLAAVESLAHPSPLDAVAAAVDALPRAQDRSGGRADRAPCAAVGTVIGLLRELEESAQVKGYAPERWAALGIPADGAADCPKLWWSVGKWRKAAAAVARRDKENMRREEARREEDRTRRESRVRSTVEELLEQRRRQDLYRNLFEGPGAS